MNLRVGLHGLCTLEIVKTYLHYSRSNAIINFWRLSFHQKTICTLKISFNWYSILTSWSNFHLLKWRMAENKRHYTIQNRSTSSPFDRPSPSVLFWGNVERMTELRQFLRQNIWVASYSFCFFKSFKNNFKHWFPIHYFLL